MGLELKWKPPETLTYAKQKRSTEGCSKFKSPETRQVQERLVSTLELSPKGNKINMESGKRDRCTSIWSHRKYILMVNVLVFNICPVIFILIHTLKKISYRIAGNFHGRKFSRFKGKSE